MDGQESPASFNEFMQKADVALKQASPPSRAEFVRFMVLLFTAMRTCHVAFHRRQVAKTSNGHEDTYSDAGRSLDETWFQAVNALKSVIQTLGLTLHILAPEIFREVAYYAHVESQAAFGDSSLRYLMQIDYYNPPSDAEFNHILDRLGQFIRDNFSAEEIFQASTSASS